MAPQGMNNMVNIGTKLQQIRQDQGLSLRALAARADVSPSLLSLIENGKANPSVMSLLSIAAALSVPVQEFFPDDAPEGDDPAAPANRLGDGAEPEQVPVAAAAPLAAVASAAGANGTPFAPLEETATPPTDQPRPMARTIVRPVVHPPGRPRIELTGGVIWERLTSGAEPGIEFLEVTYQPGGSSGPAMSRHNGREYGVVVSGELLLELGFERYHLEPGDSIAFDSSTPHRLSNPGATEMHAIWVNLSH
jgi:transcriptional regulator with XRE-family HTH domain/mannose-6-phosphate isomerase-like protein (cupin superfamily)